MSGPKSFSAGHCTILTNDWNDQCQYYYLMWRRPRPVCLGPALRLSCWCDCLQVCRGHLHHQDLFKHSAQPTSTLPGCPIYFHQCSHCSSPVVIQCSLFASEKPCFSVSSSSCLPWLWPCLILFVLLVHDSCHFASDRPSAKYPWNHHWILLAPVPSSPSFL